MLDAGEAGFGAAAAGEGIGMAAPGVGGGVLTDAGADGVEVDVCGDGLGGESAFDEDAFEALFPEASAALVAAVEPGGEALEEDFHELAEVVHAVGVGVEEALDFGGMAGFPGFGEESALFFDFPGGVEDGEAAEEFVLGDGVGGAWGDFEEDVEVIGHEAVGEDAAAGEVLGHAHEGAEFVEFLGSEGKASVDDAGDEVVDGGFEGGVFPGSEPSTTSHEWSLEERAGLGKGEDD